MIPYAILMGTLITENRKIEIRVLDLSPDSFTFRLGRGHKLSALRSIRLSFLSFEKEKYESIELMEYCLEKVETNRFYDIYRMITEEPDFQLLSSKLMKEYLRYISLKQSGDDGGLSENLVKYLAQKDQIYASSGLHWIQERMTEVKEHLNTEERGKWNQLLPLLSLGVEIQSDELKNAFLTMEYPDFCSYYMEAQGLSFHPFNKTEIQAVYLGNGYCEHLMPDTEELIRLFHRAGEQKVSPILILPPKIHQEEKRRAVLEICSDYAKQSGTKMELIINDWGTVEELRKYYADTLIPIAGILLNKRRKDSRLPYKWSGEKQQELLRENPSNAAFYQEYLKEYFGIVSYVYESCGYDYEIAEGEHIVTLPFYQMNTSGHCTMYAFCKNGNRGKQQPVNRCPEYCKNHMLLYPEHVSMIGKWNSLFGYDGRILWDAEYFMRVTENGKHRVILQEVMI